jgi:hypothetical protein
MSAASVDPDDDKYLAAALEGRATLVVTGDPDLLALEEHQRVRIVNPRAFLGLLGGWQRSRCNQFRTCATCRRNAPFLDRSNSGASERFCRFWHFGIAARC